MRTIILSVGLFLLVPLAAFAQEAQIIDLSGRVVVRRTSISGWIKAEKEMVLKKQAEIKTLGDSFCTLAFDKERKNILTLKKNSQIKIESVMPGNIFLPKGRVFTRIKNIDQVKKFEVRTPTAISGARGTGWVTEYNEGRTEVSCLDETIFVNTLDGAGNVVDSMDIKEGFELEVRENGERGELRELSQVTREEWTNFADVVQTIESQGPAQTQDQDRRLPPLEGTKPKEPEAGEPDKGILPDQQKPTDVKRPPQEHLDGLNAQEHPPGDKPHEGLPKDGPLDQGDHDRPETIDPNHSQGWEQGAMEHNPGDRPPFEYGNGFERPDGFIEFDRFDSPEHREDLRDTKDELFQENKDQHIFDPSHPPPPPPGSTP